MAERCIQCDRRVTLRQQAVECDRCQRWQHRACDTGITIAQYRLAVETEQTIDFVCQPCIDSIPTFMSEDLDDDSSIHIQLPVANSTILQPDIEPPPTPEVDVNVLKRILEELGTSSVEGFLLDFEKAAWLAIREVFPGVPIKGCVFHWTQALWRKVQQLGLSTTYRQRKGVYDYIRQLMALPFLPHNQIETAFRPLKALAKGEKLVDFVNYIDIQWFRNSVFDVESWSVFKENVRTNNDVEGWHYRLNSKAGSGTSFYKLVPLLRREAELMSLAVNGGTLSRREKKKYCVVQSRLENLWDKYMAEDMSTGAFLKRCGAIYAVTESRELSE